MQKASDGAVMAGRRKAGRTAYGAASMRAMEAFEPADRRLFDDPVLVDLLPGWWTRALVHARLARAAFRALLDRSAPGIRGALLCRTCCIDDAVRDAVRGEARTSARPLVILGAGLDTRAYRMPELAQTPVLEIDLAEVQEAKRRGLERRLGAVPTHVRLLPTDFESESLDDVLARGFLPADAPAIFLWEGVTQYLRPEAVDAVLRAVAKRPKGTELIFTYVLESAVGSRPGLWHFGLEPSHLSTFLAGRGLALRSDVGAEDHVARYVRPRGRDLAVSEIERVARAGV